MSRLSATPVEMAQDQSFNRQTFCRSNPGLVCCLLPHAKYVVTKRWTMLGAKDTLLTEQSTFTTIELNLLSVEYKAKRVSYRPAKFNFACRFRWLVWTLLAQSSLLVPGVWFLLSQGSFFLGVKKRIACPQTKRCRISQSGGSQDNIMKTLRHYYFPTVSSNQKWNFLFQEKALLQGVGPREMNRYHMDSLTDRQLSDFAGNSLFGCTWKMKSSRQSSFKLVLLEMGFSSCPRFSAPVCLSGLLTAVAVLEPLAEYNSVSAQQWLSLAKVQNFTHCIAD